MREVCGAVAQANTQRLIHPLTHSPLLQDGKKGTKMVRSLMDQDSDSLIGKAKTTCTSKAKR